MIANLFNFNNIIRRGLALTALSLLSTGSAVFAALFACMAVIAFGDSALFVTLCVAMCFIFSGFVFGAWAGILYVKERW